MNSCAERNEIGQEILQINTKLECTMRLELGELGVEPQLDQQ